MRERGLCSHEVWDGDNQMARIAVASFRHETNTFAPHKAAMVDFETGYSWPALVRGEELPAAVKGFNLAIAGFIETALAQGQIGRAHV